MGVSYLNFYAPFDIGQIDGINNLDRITRAHVKTVKMIKFKNASVNIQKILTTHWEKINHAQSDGNMNQ